MVPIVHSSTVVILFNRLLCNILPVHVSDVHSSFENIEALDKWLKEKGEK